MKTGSRCGGQCGELLKGLVVMVAKGGGGVGRGEGGYQWGTGHHGLLGDLKEGNVTSPASKATAKNIFYFLF